MICKNENCNNIVPRTYPSINPNPLEIFSDFCPTCSQTIKNLSNLLTNHPMGPYCAQNDWCVPYTLLDPLGRALYFLAPPPFLMRIRRMSTSIPGVVGECKSELIFNLHCSITDPFKLYHASPPMNGLLLEEKYKTISPSDKHDSENILRRIHGLGERRSIDDGFLLELKRIQDDLRALFNKVGVE